MATAVEKQETKSNLGEFFSNQKPKAEPVAKAEPKPEQAKPEVKEEPKAEVKAETKVEVKDGKEKSQKEEKQEVAVKDSKPDAAKEEKPSVNWEDESNPYKKRYHDTQGWGNRINQELLAIKKQAEIANKKLDGTYDPAKDEVTVSPDVEKANAELSGRVAASLAAAHKQHGGKEKVQAILNRFYEEHGQNPYMMNRIWTAELPAVEAITIMADQDFRSKYGNDPDAIQSNIRKEIEAELRARITEEVTKQFNERIQLKEKQPSGLSEVKGTSDGKEPRAFAPTALDALFKH